MRVLERAGRATRTELELTAELAVRIARGDPREHGPARAEIEQLRDGGEGDGCAREQRHPQAETGGALVGKGDPAGAVEQQELDRASEGLGILEPDRGGADQQQVDRTEDECRACVRDREPVDAVEPRAADACKHQERQREDRRLGQPQGRDR